MPSSSATRKATSRPARLPALGPSDANKEGKRERLTNAEADVVIDTMAEVVLAVQPATRVMTPTRAYRPL